MSDDKKETLNEFAGVSIETALTNEQVSQAIVVEMRLGIRGGACAFLSPLDGVATEAGAISESI